MVKDHGVDIVDCSSGGLVPATVPTGPGYQVSFAEAFGARWAFRRSPSG